MPNANERDALPELPRPACTYADHSYPAFSAAQMSAYALAARETCFTPATAPNADVPTGAIVNGRTYIERIEQEGFECEAGNIQMCTDWQELRRCFETLAGWAMYAARAQQAGAPLTDAQRKDLLLAAQYLSGDEGDVGLTSTDATRVVHTLCEIGGLDELVAADAGAPLPLAPIDEERGDRVLLTVIRRQQLDEGLDPTCGYVKALDRAIERLATPPQALPLAPDFDLRTSAGGRGYVEWFFTNRIKRHDFNSYIREALAADFACALSRHLSATPPRATLPASEADEKPYAFAIYIAAESRIELVHDLEEAMDELTNCECEITPLYTRAQPQPGTSTAWLDDLTTFSPAAGSDIVGMVRGGNYVKLADVKAALLDQPQADAARMLLDLTATGRQRINAAAEALSKVLAFVTMPAYENEVSRALSGLRAIQALAPQADAAEPVLLSQWEQKAVLADPMGLECLINYHDAQEAGADAVEHGAGHAHARRALELLTIGRAIIEEDPGIWDFAQKAPFKLRHGEREAQAPGARGDA